MTSLLGLLVIVLSIILLSGRGAVFIAGLNTMSKKDKESYKVKALCKFMGMIMLPIGLLIPTITIGIIYTITWLPAIFITAVVGLIIFAVIYANTGNHFKQ